MIFKAICCIDVYLTVASTAQAKLADVSPQKVKQVMLIPDTYEQHYFNKEYKLCFHAAVLLIEAVFRDVPVN